jgi:hypothetical protein
MKRKRERGRKVKESDTVSGGEERAQAEEKEKGEVANAKEEERHQAEITRRVAGTGAPYVDPPSGKPPG